MREEASGVSERMERFVADESIAGGDTIEFAGGALRAVMAPGHSPAMLCFHCPEQRLLFSTDAILERTTPNIGVHWFYQGNPLGEYLNSLRTLELLDVDKVLPSTAVRSRVIASGSPASAATTASAARRYWPRWGAVAVRLRDRRRRLGRRPAGRRAALRHGEALAHLEYVFREGRVEQRLQNGVTLWKAAGHAAG